MKRFERRNVVVTGAGSGIGAACVRRLHQEGATVIAVDVAQRGLDTMQAEFPGSDRLLGAVLDVSDQQAAIELVDRYRSELGSVHGLINCAGITGAGGVANNVPDQHSRIMAINLDGTINMCQAFVNAVKDDDYPRAIVNISSGAGILGVANRLSYVASKFGVSGITKSMCPELGPHGIRVNAVAPGVTRTPLVHDLLKDTASEQRVKDSHPIGRPAEPFEIAAVIVFLLTDDASFMTGSVVSVDGGQTACL